MTQPIDIITRAMKDIGAVVHKSEIIAAYQEAQRLAAQAINITQP
jgi:hypothetical protein